MKTALIIVAILLALGYLFVQWANKPENVEALKQDRAQKAAQKVVDAQQQAEANKLFEAQKATMQLVMDESFADNKLAYLVPTSESISHFKIENNQLHYAATVSPKQNAADYFLLSKTDFEDFIAEMDMDIFGRIAYIGLLWDAESADFISVKNQSMAYSTPNSLTIKNKKRHTFSLGSFFEAVTKQKLRVEKIGKHLRVLVNDHIYFDQTVEENKKGKIGIYLAHGAADSHNESINVVIKSFKVWQPKSKN